MSTLNKELLDFLNSSHTEYNAVYNLKKMLLNLGFEELKESEERNLKCNKSYFMTRNSNSIIAFKTPKQSDNLYFLMSSAHTDSPTFKIKHNPTLRNNGYQKIKVEGYGSMINVSWVDKPLSVAGRLIYASKNEIKEKIIDVDKDLLIIPNVAIHQKSDINENLTYNKQIDINPIIGNDVEEDLFMNLLNSYLEKDEKLLSYDLYLYNRNKAGYIGVNDDYISSPKLDDLACVFASFKSLVDTPNHKNAVLLAAAFENEEVGSLSYSGADSNLLSDVLSRIIAVFDNSSDAIFRVIQKSFMISADNGHAVHPNHPELSDDKNLCELNKGFMIKYNGNMHYATDGFSSGLIKMISEKHEIPYQEFFNRSDKRGGLTLGNISNSHVSVRTVDVGLPQLAMHSNYETMGSKDFGYLYDLIVKFMSMDIDISLNKISLKED